MIPRKMVNVAESCCLTICQKNYNTQLQQVTDFDRFAARAAIELIGTGHFHHPPLKHNSDCTFAHVACLGKHHVTFAKPDNDPILFRVPGE